MSGVFRTPVQGSYGALFEAASPFRALHETLLGMTQAGPVDGGVAVAVWGLLLPTVAVVFAGQLTKSLGRVSLS